MSETTQRTNASVRYYLDVAVRRSWLLAGVFAGIAALVMVGAVLQPPEYQATASLLVNEESWGSGRSFLFSGREGAFSARGPNLANHIEILRSRTLAQLALDQVRGTRPELQLSPEQLQRQVTVRPARDADIIRLSVRASSPELAREMASAYVTAYQEHSLTRSRADVSAVKEFVERQLGAVAGRLDSAERRLEQYKRSEHVVDIAEETRALVERQTELLVRHQEASVGRLGLEQRVGYLREELEQIGCGPATRLDSAVTAAITSLRGEMDGIEAERTNLLVAGYAATSPRVRSLELRHAAVRSRLGDELGRLSARAGATDPARARSVVEQVSDLGPQLAAAQAAEAALAEEVRRYDAELNRLPAQERALARLNRDVEVNRQVYALLAQRREESRIQEAGRIPAIATVDPPERGAKTKPNYRTASLFALLLAASLSMAAVVAVDRLDTRIRRPEDLERQGFALLATVPRFAAGLVADKPTAVAKGDQSSAASASAAEAFRVLRTNMQFAAAGRPRRTLLVTSAGAGEGKTTIAANLAAVLAQAGKRVLLVDADLRRPRQHVFFGLRKKPGVTDVAMLGVPIEQAVRPGPVANLDVLTAGTLPPSPVDFLNAEPFGQLMRQSAERYDVVVVDSPPVLVSADAAILASRLEGVVLVARVGSTDRRALAEAQKVLAQAGAKVLGIVANDQKPRPAYGYYRYRYHYHHYRYREAAPAAAEG